MFQKPEQEALTGRYGKQAIALELHKPFNELMRQEYSRDEATAWDILLMSPAGVQRVDRILGKRTKSRSSP
jgi:hypothetical protein